ncbi:MAG: response regulator [Acidimicrobiales bacterium]
MGEDVVTEHTDEPAVRRETPSAVHPIRVLIVDDHALVREGTGQLLDQDDAITVVATAGSGEEALEQIATLVPDVALIDINLPAMSGLELARAVIADHSPTRILILSAYDEYAYVAEALEVGVGGYLMKTASAKELIDAVRAVHDGVFVLDRQLSRRLLRRHDDAAPTVGTLTPRETAVLESLVKGRSNKQIAAELELGIRTVEGYVSNILGKLGVTSRTEAVTYAISHRLVATPTDGG